MHALKPRNAMLKFDLPYRDAKNFSYIKGELRLQVGFVPWCLFGHINPDHILFCQPFAPKTSTEVKLVVDTPPSVLLSTAAQFPRDLYNSNVHDECLFHHNSQRRLGHMDSDSQIKASAGYMFIWPWEKFFKNVSQPSLRPA